MKWVLGGGVLLPQRCLQQWLLLGSPLRRPNGPAWRASPRLGAPAAAAPGEGSACWVRRFSSQYWGRKRVRGIEKLDPLDIEGYPHRKRGEEGTSIFDDNLPMNAKQAQVLEFERNIFAALGTEPLGHCCSDNAGQGRADVGGRGVLPKHPKLVSSWEERDLILSTEANEDNVEIEGLLHQLGGRLGQQKRMGVQATTLREEFQIRQRYHPCITHSPKKILLIRHGESQSHIDENLCTFMPDWRIPLTDLGIEQAKYCGQRLRKLVGDQDVHLYHSPYVRTAQTTQHLLNELDSTHVLSVTEEPRIAEQQFGNLHTLDTIRRCKEERHEFGRFFYRFPDGEAGLDVYNRITSFIYTIRRVHTARDSTVVIVTHGLALRLFLMRWFQWTVEQFEATHTPPHCGIAVMERVEGSLGRYTLTPITLEMIGANKAPTTTAIGRNALRKAYVNAFLSY